LEHPVLSFHFIKAQSTLTKLQHFLSKIFQNAIKFSKKAKMSPKFPKTFKTLLTMPSKFPISKALSKNSFHNQNQAKKRKGNAKKENKKDSDYRLPSICKLIFCLHFYYPLLLAPARHLGASLYDSVGRRRLGLRLGWLRLLCMQMSSISCDLFFSIFWGVLFFAWRGFFWYWKTFFDICKIFGDICRIFFASKKFHFSIMS
jgi:hypothetical protein